MIFPEIYVRTEKGVIKIKEKVVNKAEFKSK